MLASSSQAASSPEFTFVSLPDYYGRAPKYPYILVGTLQNPSRIRLSRISPYGTKDTRQTSSPSDIPPRNVVQPFVTKQETPSPISEPNAPIYRCTTYNPRHNLPSSEPETPEPPKSPSNPPESDSESVQDLEDDSFSEQSASRP